MKIYYEKKADFLEFFLENTDYYEDESESLSYYVYKKEKDDSIIGYGILNAKANLASFDKTPPHLKVALYVSFRTACVTNKFYQDLMLL